MPHLIDSPTKHVMSDCRASSGGLPHCSVGGGSVSTITPMHLTWYGDNIVIDKISVKQPCGYRYVIPMKSVNYYCITTQIKCETKRCVYFVGCSVNVSSYYLPKMLDDCGDKSGTDASQLSKRTSVGVFQTEEFYQVYHCNTVAYEALTKQTDKVMCEYGISQNKLHTCLSRFIVLSILPILSVLLRGHSVNSQNYVQSATIPA